MCAGKDLDPAKENDYRTVFTPNGCIVRKNTFVG